MRDLSPKRRELIRPILDQPRQYVLMSVRKLAAAVGSDAMAVLRAIRGMGFEGYADFRQYLHELALVQATQLDTMRPGLARASDVPAHLIASVLAGRREPRHAAAHARYRPRRSGRRAPVQGAADRPARRRSRDGPRQLPAVQPRRDRSAGVGLHAAGRGRPRGPLAPVVRPRDRDHVPPRAPADGGRAAAGARPRRLLRRRHRHAPVAGRALRARVLRHAGREHLVRRLVRGADGAPEPAARGVRGHEEGANDAAAQGGRRRTAHRFPLVSRRRTASLASARAAAEIEATTPRRQACLESSYLQAPEPHRTCSGKCAGMLIVSVPAAVPPPPATRPSSGPSCRRAPNPVPYCSSGSP